MTILLAADTVAILGHALIDVLVAYSGLGVSDAQQSKALYKPKLDMTGVTTVLFMILPCSFI